MKVKSTSWLFVIMFISTFLGMNIDQTHSANEENCRTFNLNQVFSFGYNPDFPTWTSPGIKKVISWVALESGELNGKKIQRGFGNQYQGWLKEAFQSWDDALDSISFQEVSAGVNADIKIGWTQVLQLDYESLFQVKTAQPTRTVASIELKNGSAFLIFKDNFIQVIQSDIGHILGMGYISPSSQFESVMEWPFQAPYRQVPLGEFDVSLIRTIYSESTCPSTFSPVIQSKINENAASKSTNTSQSSPSTTQIKPSLSFINITGNTLNLSVNVGSGSGKPDQIYLMAPQLSSLNGGKILGKMSGSKATWAIKLDKALSGKTIPLKIVGVKNGVESEAIQTNYVIPKNFVIMNKPPVFPTPNTQTVICTRGQQSRAFVGKVCPPGWKG